MWCTGAAAAGLYLGAKNAPVMKLKLKDKEGGQKTLEIKGTHCVKLKVMILSDLE